MFPTAQVDDYLFVCWTQNCCTVFYRDVVKKNVEKNNGAIVLWSSLDAVDGLGWVGIKSKTEWVLSEIDVGLNWIITFKRLTRDNALGFSPPENKKVIDQ